MKNGIYRLVSETPSGPRGTAVVIENCPCGTGCGKIFVRGAGGFEGHGRYDEEIACIVWKADGRRYAVTTFKLGENVIQGPTLFTASGVVVTDRLTFLGPVEDSEELPTQTSGFFSEASTSNTQTTAVESGSPTLEALGSILQSAMRAR